MSLTLSSLAFDIKDTKNMYFYAGKQNLLKFLEDRNLNFYGILVFYLLEFFMDGPFFHI